MTTELLTELIESSIKRMKAIEAEKVSDSYKFGYCIEEAKYIAKILNYYKEDKHGNI